jgi:beta-phosphoglucomutase-like phosphatase (HAD superfamily)/dTDP-glucose pyrophosphorylase
MNQPYNKLFIFDLDGVLIDSRELHYLALNDAIDHLGPEFGRYVITREEHLATYDGLPTRKKLEILTEKKGFSKQLYDLVFLEKQKSTLNIINATYEPSEKLNTIFRYLKEHNYQIAIASNSIRATVDAVVAKMKLYHWVDYYISNEDVDKSKPFPMMYWKCMEICHAIPSTTVIVEDSHIGRRGALDSGATLLPVENPDDLTLEKVKEMVEGSEVKKTKVPWRSKDLNVLVPMAGAGSRFSIMGYTFPKPLIEVNGKPMIQVVVENLNIEANYIFICQKNHYEKYHLQYLLNLIAPGCKIVQVDGMTEGAACTTLVAEHLIDNDKPLLIANSDQFIEWDANEVMYAFSADQIDGGILTFPSTHPKWSYAKVGEDGFVEKVAEKMPISNDATCGVYYWKKGSDYVKNAWQMIDKDIRTNGEFYICPVYNEAILDGKKIRVKRIEKMWGLGTPEDLNYFLDHYKG